MNPLALSALGVPLWPVAKELRRREALFRVVNAASDYFAIADKVKPGRGARFTGGKQETIK